MLHYKIMDAASFNDLPNSLSPDPSGKLAVVESNLLIATAKALIDIGMNGIIYTVEHKDILSIKFRTTLGKDIFIRMMHENNTVTEETKMLDDLIGHDHLEEVGLLLMSARRDGFEFITILPEA